MSKNYSQWQVYTLQLKGIAQWFNKRVPFESPLRISILRIATCIAILLRPEVYATSWYASLPLILRTQTIGDWTVTLFPSSGYWPSLISTIFLISCISSLVGYRTQISCAICAFTGIYVLGLPQLFSKVHHYHTLLWSMALLSVVPSGDALSLDAWRKFGAAQCVYPIRRSRFYYWIMLSFWLLLGVAYFFPGLWKIVSLGPMGVYKNLWPQMYSSWTTLHGWDPPFFRVDRFPSLLVCFTFIVLLLEIGAPFLIFSGRSRIFLFVLAVTFHWGAYVLLYINFFQLYPIIITLLPWDSIQRFTARFAGIPPMSISRITFSSSRHACALCMTLFLFIGSFSSGLLHYKDAWPFSCFPTFDVVWGYKKTTINISYFDEHKNAIHLESDIFLSTMGLSRWMAFMKHGVLEGNQSQKENFLRSVAEVVQRQSMLRGRKVYSILAHLETIDTHPPPRKDQRLSVIGWEKIMDLRL